MRLSDYIELGYPYRRWYSHARLIVGRIAQYTGKPFDTVADVLAITSARAMLSANLRQTIDYLTGQPLGADCFLTKRIALQYWSETGIIRGLKTSAYADCLKGNDNALVLDTHMLRVLQLNQPTEKVTKGKLKIALPVFKRLAKKHNLTICQVQSSIWSGYLKTLNQNVILYDLTRMSNSPF